MTRRLVIQRLNVLTSLFFDSHEQESINVLPNFSYVFSGGTGDNRADDAIVDRLNKRSLSELDQTVFVVTDDRGLRARILDRRARYVPVGIFGVFLDDFECLK
ncbi:MAG: rRNA-processing protein FCF1 [Planctomycetota bacterium]|jgi:rRNA-processing protein FCF1